MTRLVVDEPGLADAVAGAKVGDRNALERLVAALQDGVYRLALRMTAHPQDAEDATQEILVKVITRLDGFRSESSVRTWVHRIAVRHLLDRKKSRVEALSLDFQRFGADLLDGLSVDPDPDPLMAREVKLGCTLAMLTCLDREHRLAFILCDVFDLPTADAAAVCEISEGTLRQRLSRARRALEAFTVGYCGLVNRSAPCSCSKRVARAEELGRVHRGRGAPGDALRSATEEMEALHTTAGLIRSHPDYRAPDRVWAAVSAIFDSSSGLLSHQPGR
jgi:RNA polymerase sigma factor (sigma-70 family)